MVGMKIWLRFVFCFCFVVSPVALAQDAYITLESETTDVFAGDAIVVDIEYTGLPEDPSFDRLRETAIFERETYGTRIAVVKGKVVEINIRRMEFTSEEPGTYLFGPLEVDGILSNSIAVKVLPAGTSSWTAADQDATISLSLTPENASIYQMLTLDITLNHTFPIADEDIILPRLDGFETRSLVTARRTIGFNSLREIKWKILLFPQTSGKHTIEPVQWSGTIVQSRTERAAFKRTSQAIDLSIQPANTDAATQNADQTRQWWLPASSLQLSEQWSKDVRELTAGEEVTRIIRLSANGVTSGQLPQPNILESHAINQTLVNVERNEALTSDGINSTATFTYRVNAQSPIPVFLDTVRVPWWNTIIGENDEAIIPARRINIGLPERADLLASLARNEAKKSFLQKLPSLTRLGQLENNNTNASFLFIFCALLSAGIIYLSRQLLKERKHNKIRSAQRFLMLQLAREEAWNSLYLAIDDQHSYISTSRHTAATGSNATTITERSINQLKEITGKLAFKKQIRNADNSQPTNVHMDANEKQLNKDRVLELVKTL